MALFAFNNVKLNSLTVTNTSNSLSGVILDYGRLMNKNILVFFVIATYEAITVFNIKPLDSTKYIRCDYFFGWLCRLLFIVAIIGLVRVAATIVGLIIVI